MWDIDSGNYFDPGLLPVCNEFEFVPGYTGLSQSREGMIAHLLDDDQSMYHYFGVVRLPAGHPSVAVIDARMCDEIGQAPAHYLLDMRKWWEYINRHDDAPFDAVTSIEFLTADLTVLDVSRDGSRLLAGTAWKNAWQNVLSVWDVASGTCVSTLQPKPGVANSGHQNTIKQARFVGGDPAYVLSVSYSVTWGAAIGSDDIAGMIWDATTGQARVPLFCWTGDRATDTENIYDYATLNHGRWMALIRGDAETDDANDRIIRVIDTQSGGVVTTLTHPPCDSGFGNYVRKVVATGQDRYLVSLTENESLARVWDVARGVQVAVCGFEHQPVVDVDIESTSDGVRIATTHSGRSGAALWRLPTPADV